MADNKALIMGEIQDKYVPFIKKFIEFLEKSRKITPDNLNMLKCIYTVFTTSPTSEQIKVFNTNKKKLEKWLNNPKQYGMYSEESSSSAQGSTRFFVEDTDSSQGDSDETPAKRLRSSESGSSADESYFNPMHQIKKEKVVAADEASLSMAVSSDVNDNANILFVEDTDSSIEESIQGLKQTINELQNDQKTLRSTTSNLTLILSRIEAKVDLLLAKTVGSNESTVMDDELTILTALPVNVEGFSRLNGLLAESQSFRERLKKILLTTSGKNVKGLTSNLLKKIILDDIADSYSLTGKSTLGFKLPFDKTVVYKLIMEVCCHAYGNSQENIVREAISDWLMQSKFRKSRREMRKCKKGNSSNM